MQWACRSNGCGFPPNEDSVTPAAEVRHTLDPTRAGSVAWCTARGVPSDDGWHKPMQIATGTHVTARAMVQWCAQHHSSSRTCAR